jgi:Cu(I)/Ag(I) efflux system membrane fusion protein
MAAALGADDLAAFNSASKPAMDTTGAMVGSLQPNVGNLDALDGARHFHGFEDLKGARAAFHRFSVAATAALEPLRKAGETPDFQIYECGMVNQAVPDAPKKARWIQTGGREMANPFFGREMSDCGEEIKR